MGGYLYIMAVDTSEMHEFSEDIEPVAFRIE